MVRVADIAVRLDSADPAAPWNFTASHPPLKCLCCDGKSHITTLSTPEGPQRKWDDPLAALQWMADSANDFPGARWIGYLSYDLARLFEPLPAHKNDDLALPLFVFTYHHPSPLPSLSAPPSPPTNPFVTSNFSRHDYQAAVERVISYINAGDIFQANLSQRFRTVLIDAPKTIYHRLQLTAPARYGAFLNYGDFALLSNSPELFLRVTADRHVITRPIKGTRPRTPGMQAELRDSAKDQTELNMIVDLERNDLGRICRIGTVKVTEPRVIETHPTVYHGVATIEGYLRDDTSFVDMLRATFPTGSVTGAPKIRAMQIIDELEPAPRGPYCGAIGYLAAGGTMEFNVAIRTMIIANGNVHIPVGGGIVADSQPAQEYAETLVKARAMFTALGIADVTPQ